MTQAVSRTQIQTFLAQTQPFSQLGTVALQNLAGECEMLRYRIGQTILQREVLPANISIIYIGQARLLGHDHRTQAPISLKLVGPGEVLGWGSLVRGVGCETAIASTESICITVPAAVFLAYLEKEEVLRRAFCDRANPCELSELLSLELQRRALGNANLKELTVQVLPGVEVLNFPSGTPQIPELEPKKLWLVSSGTIGAFSEGSRFPTEESGKWQPVRGKQGVRLLGLNCV